MNNIRTLALMLRGLAIKAGTPCFVKVINGEKEDITKAAVLFESFIKDNSRLPDKLKLSGGGTAVFSRHPASKVAVVTGGAQGLGAGLVRELVSSSYFVFIADLNVKGASALADELNKQYGYRTALPLAVNIADENSVRIMTESIVDECGGLDLFISNAGVLKAGSVKSMPLDDFNFVTSIDYTGFFLCTKYAAKAMSIQNQYAGHQFSDIIQINSKSGLSGSNKNGAYAAAKFGGIGLVQSFALELIADKIKVNAVCPGNFLDGPLWSDPEKGLFIQYLKTGKVPGAQTIEDVRAFYESKVPMGRGCTPEDVAKAVFYIIDQKYETGQAVPVTGGQIMLH